MCSCGIELIKTRQYPYLSIPVAGRHIVVVRDHDVGPYHGPVVTHVAVHVVLIHHPSHVGILSQHCVELVYLM